MKIRELFEKFLKGLNSLEIVSDSFLKEKTKDEKEVGIITEDETKKLYYYTSYYFDNNMTRLIGRENNLLEIEGKNNF